MASGPLVGLRVVEFAGIGAAPFCGMLLADLGADVIRVDRKQAAPRGAEILGRGKRSIALDLKTPEGVAAALALVEKSDALIEGFRPGVMERLGLGPDVAMKRNPKLVYGRLTGWGQTGPRSQMAGHDINYIAVAGALAEMGSDKETPAPPLNLVGDFGGGALYLAFGLCAALWETKASGRGQVIDCAMTDGVASMMTLFHGMRTAGQWVNERKSNLLDGGAPFYATYACADDKPIAIGALEPEFYAELMAKLELTEDDIPKRMDRKHWPKHQKIIAERIRTKTRDQWMQVFENSDACVSPVLTMDEAVADLHNVARATFVVQNDMVQPAPAPRFSRTDGAIQGPPPEIGQHSEEVLKEWGVDADVVAALKAAEAE